MHSSARTSIFETVVALLRITSMVLGVYWVAIFVATHLPGSSLPSLGSDKAYHLIAFFGLSVLLNWVMALKLSRVWQQVVLTLTICILYAMLDEWSQQFVAGRTPDLADVAADSCGAALGVIVFAIVRSYMPPLRRRARA